MLGFISVLFFIFLIITIVFAANWRKSKRKGVTGFATKKNTLILTAITVVLMLIGAALSPEQSTDKKAAESSSSSSVKKSSSSKKSSTKKSTKSATLDAINSEIMESLAQDQGFANGTLDENGNSTDSGTPNANFAGYLAIDRMSYDSNDMLTIQVNENFNLLDDKTKTAAINQAQNMAVVAKGNHQKLSTSEYGDKPYTVVHLGSESVGRSKMTDTANFKWVKE